MSGSILMDAAKPVAYDSPDHIQPHGTARDNSSNLWFNRKLFAWRPAREVRVLDIGCSGGGFVKSILDAGGFAVGVEGSDYSRKAKRAEWATIPDHLFTADATETFQLYREGAGGTREPLKFDVITAWEFFEHIAEDGLSAVIQNIDRHLEPGGVVLVSIAPWEDVVDGVRLHQSVHESPWWIEKFGSLGMANLLELEEYFFTDWVRGGPGTASFASAFARKGDRVPNLDRLKAAKRAFLVHETLVKLRWKALSIKTRLGV
jgi:SAM-dependent methyltransferase